MSDELKVVAWGWKNIATGGRGVYWEDPAKFMAVSLEPEYEWTELTTLASARARIDELLGSLTVEKKWRKDAEELKEAAQERIEAMEAEKAAHHTLLGDLKAGCLLARIQGSRADSNKVLGELEEILDAHISQNQKEGKR